jgi:hypothetical protein
MSIGLQRGLVRVVARDSSGNAIASASLTISDQGATVSVATSGTDPLTVSVFDVGSLSTTGSTVKINTGTTTYTATVVDENTVTISGFAGTLAVSLLDRLVNSGSTPSLQLSSQSASAVDSAPTTGSDGAYSAYVRGGAYDVTITKAGITTQLLRDIWVEADEKRINTFPTTSAAVLYRIDAVRSATWAATDTLFGVAIAGTDKFKVDGVGGVTAAAGVTATTGTFSGALAATTGTFTGDLDSIGGYRTQLDGWYIANAAGTTGPTAMFRFADTPMGADGGTTFYPIRAGSITGVFVESTAARTAGTLTVEVYVAGVATGLTAVLDGTNTTFKATTQAKDLDTFTAGQAITLRFQTVGWTPTTADISAGFEFET